MQAAFNNIADNILQNPGTHKTLVFHLVRERVAMINDRSFDLQAGRRLVRLALATPLFLGDSLPLISS